jgi:hypothetical protein
MVMRLLKMSQEISSEVVKRELENTDRLISRVKATNHRVNEARSLQANAYEQHRRGNQIEAYRLTKQAQRLLYAVLKDYGKINPQLIKKAIDETEHLLGLTDLPAKDRSIISSLIEEAKDLYQRGRYRDALVKISAAKRILDKKIEE